MKKLYRKSTVHPSPPVISDQLAFLPATILTLTAALIPEEREVLAYLISGNHRSKGNNKNNGVSSKGFPAGSGFEAIGDHPPLFHCNCFRCYMSYWVRWDSSPNRQLIHEIIDAFEDWLAQSTKHGGGFKNSRNERRNKRRHGQSSKGSELIIDFNTGKEELEGSEFKSKIESSIIHGDHVNDEEDERGSVRKLVDYVGGRIWGVWGQ